ncbi:hypothetical protein LY78DRAFT_61047 [Colletotrichum sublineola]|nr:hypothetical protein LY78DRAFT_61047 [Colletotrichum sublineola]
MLRLSIHNRTLPRAETAQIQSSLYDEDLSKDPQKLNRGHLTAQSRVANQGVLPSFARVQVQVYPNLKGSHTRYFYGPGTTGILVAHVGGYFPCARSTLPTSMFRFFAVRDPSE